MGNNNSLDDVKEKIQGWADSNVLNDEKKNELLGGTNTTNKPPSWGSFCGGNTPQ